MFSFRIVKLSVLLAFGRIGGVRKKQEVIGVLACFTHHSQRSQLFFGCIGDILGRKKISAGQGRPAGY